MHESGIDAKHEVMVTCMIQNKNETASVIAHRQDGCFIEQIGELSSRVAHSQLGYAVQHLIIIAAVNGLVGSVYLQQAQRPSHQCTTGH